MSIKIDDRKGDLFFPFLIFSSIPISMLKLQSKISYFPRF